MDRLVKSLSKSIITCQFKFVFFNDYKTAYLKEHFIFKKNCIYKGLERKAEQRHRVACGRRGSSLANICLDVHDWLSFICFFLKPFWMGNLKRWHNLNCLWKDSVWRTEPLSPFHCHKIVNTYKWQEFVERSEWWHQSDGARMRLLQQIFALPLSVAFRKRYRFCLKVW